MPQDRTPSGVAPSDWAGIRQAYERHRHQVVSFKGRPNGWQARNPGQQWLTRFDAHGFAVQPDSGGWTWGLTLQRYGAGTTQRAVASSARVHVEGDRVTYTWDNTVDEWLVNEQRGLEHGFTVRKRPAGDGPLTLWIGVRGELRPDVQPDGQGVVFRDVDGASALSYAGLTVLDSDGHMVAAHFEPAGARLALVVNDSGAHYPLVIDPLAQQTAYLKASNTNAFDSFGSSVAVSGETVIVAASRAKTAVPQEWTAIRRITQLQGLAPHMCSSATAESGVSKLISRRRIPARVILSAPA